MKLITPAELRRTPEKTKLDDDSLVVCAMETEVKFDDGESEDRTIDFTISTETVDSYKDVVYADGWDLSRYLKNPVVLWAHIRSQLPVGKASDVRVEGESLKASAEFASKEVYEFADNVYRMLRAGFLKATSVGFIPKEWTWDEERGGFNFIKSELFEFSVVPVPANPDALANAVDRGDDLTFLKDWVEETLDLWRPDGHVALWVPRSDVEAVHKLVSIRPTSVGYSQPTTVGYSQDVTDGTAVDTGDVGVVTTTNTVDLGVTITGGTYEPTITADPYHEFWSPNTRDHDLDGNDASQWSGGYVNMGPDPLVIAALDEMKKLIEELAAKVADLTEAKAAKEPVEEPEEPDEIIDLSVVLEDEEHQDDIAEGLRKLLAGMGDEPDAETLRKAVQAETEKAIMKRTGKLPKEV